RPRPGIAERRPGGSPDRGGDSGSDLAAGILDGGGGHGNFGPRRGLGCGAERASAPEGNSADRNREGTGHNLPDAASADPGDHSGAALPGGAAALCSAVERGVGNSAHGGRKYSSGGALRG